jgi:ferritin-like metal-binding protein YciE
MNLHKQTGGTMKASPTKQSLFKQKLGDKSKSEHKDSIKKILDEESYADFMEALKDKSISAASLCSALKDCGYEISESSIFRWRKSVLTGERNEK